MAFKSTYPTIVEESYDAISDAERLYKAMKGIGTDESKIIKVLGKRTNKQRQEIAKYYMSNYRKNLVEHLKSETSGNFEKVLVALMTPVAKFYAREFHNALKGIGTNEKTLVELLLTLNKTELEEVKEVYKNEYKNQLVRDIKPDTSGDFKDLLVLLCEGDREESSPDDVAEKEAKALYDAEEHKTASIFRSVLAKRSFKLLGLVFAAFHKVSGHSIEDSIKKSFSGDLEDALLAIVRRTKGLNAYLATELNLAMKGIGTNDQKVIRILVARSEIDLKAIMDSYAQIYNKPLKDAVKDETSGDFKKILVELIE